MKPILKRILGHSFTRFTGLAAIGFAFDLTLLALLNRFTPLPTAATVSIAFWVTYALNFTLNRYFAFEAHGHDHPVGPQVLRFVVQVLGDYVLTLGGVIALQRLGLNIVLARVGAGGTNLVWNYLLYRFWTFKDAKRADPQEPADRPVEVSGHQQ